MVCGWDEKVFERYVAPIEAALAERYGKLDVGLTFLYLRDGNWPPDLLTPLREWLDTNLAGVPVQETGRLPPQFDVPGVGMMWVAKREGARRPGVHVGRTVPSNVRIPGETTDTIDRALAHNYERLAEYRERGYRSLMLLDARDIALTNEGEQYKAYLRVLRKDARAQLDEIWLASVFDGAKESSADYCCFRGDDELMRRANPANFMFERRHDDYWYRVIDEEARK